MARKYPFMNAYWQDKIADWASVKIPVYQTAGWSHFHLPGSINAWRRCKSRRKWLRIHRDFEWPDTYTPENLEDLKRFYDRYLKNIHNGWEMTPKVRVDVMDAFDLDHDDRRPETSFPLERTQYKKLYLNAADTSLQTTPVETESQISYDGNTGKVEFDMAFDEDTELTGYMYLRLYVEADGHDDMDLFVNIQKADASGRWIPWFTLNEPHPGAWGKMRVSRRELDEKLEGNDPLKFPGYEEKLAKQTRKTGLSDAAISATGKIEGMPVVVVVLDSHFFMGSMGTAVGEKVTRAIEYAANKKLPLIIFSASGGARMQEGILSLMQMAKTSAAIEEFSSKGGLYISYLTHPTTGGVTASFASLGDIMLAEPGALIGFAGPRVIEQTIGEKLPAGFQRSEFQEEHGFVDAIVPRSEMKATLAQILRLHSKGGRR